MIDIRPDPDHPRGGFAIITIDGQPPQDGEVLVSVMHSYQQKWLGKDGWQAGQTGLPARAASWSGDRLTLLVGPDIVNNIEEDTPVQIVIGETAWDTYWPDNINHGPDVAVVGDLGGTVAAEPVKQPTIVKQQTSEPEPQDAAEGTEPADDPPSVAGDLSGDLEEDVEDDDEEEPRKSKFPLALWGVAALLALAAMAFVFLDTDDLKTAAVETPPAQSNERLTRCSVAVMQEVSGGFAAVSDRLRECSGEVSADAALGVVERAANSGDAEALRLFGTFYDDAITDEAIEGKIGLTFANDPARAADYYSRAVKAGSKEAKEALQATCARLEILSDTLAQSAHEDFCAS